jgi:hypothetical protein
MSLAQDRVSGVLKWPLLSPHVAILHLITRSICIPMSFALLWLYISIHIICMFYHLFLSILPAIYRASTKPFLTYISQQSYFFPELPLIHVVCNMSIFSVLSDCKLLEIIVSTEFFTSCMVSYKLWGNSQESFVDWNNVLWQRRPLFTLGETPGSICSTTLCFLLLGIREYSKIIIAELKKSNISMNSL